MDNRKLLFRRRSAPVSLAKRNVVFEMLKNSAFKFTPDMVLDDSLTHDVSTAEVFRHPVATAPDNRIHEAASLLAYMGAGGRSPFTRELFTDAVYLLPLKNELDKRFGEENRYADYEIKPVMRAIQNWVKIYNDKLDPIDMKAQYTFLPNDSEEEVAIAAAEAAVAEDHRVDPALTISPARQGFFSKNMAFETGMMMFLGGEAFVLLYLLANYLLSNADNVMTTYQMLDTFTKGTLCSTAIAVSIGVSSSLPRFGS